MKRSIFRAALAAALLLTTNLQAQSPMVAYRQGIEWHFYDSQNKPLFAPNKLIAPPMVTHFRHGYARVSAPVGTDKNKTVIIGQTLIDEKGKIQELKLPHREQITWRISDISKIRINEQEQIWLRVENSANGCSYFYNLQQHRLVPSVGGLSYFDYIGDGIAVGHLQQPLLPDNENPMRAIAIRVDGQIVDYDVARDFEIWDMRTQGKKSTTLKAQRITSAEGGYLIAQKDGLWGIANVRGSWAVPARYQGIGQLQLIDDAPDLNEERDYSINEGRIAASLDGSNWGIIDLKGTWIVQPQYSWVAYVDKNVWLVEDSEGYRLFINSQGKPYTLSKPKDAALDPTKATAPANTKEPEVPATIAIAIEGSPLVHTTHAVTQKEYVFNKQTNKIVASCENCQVYLLDKQSFVIVQPEKTEAFDNLGQSLGVWSKSAERTYFFSEGVQHGLILAYDVATNLYGFVDTKNKWAVPPTFGENPFEIGCVIAPDWLYVFHGNAHWFFDHKGKQIRRDATDGDTDWEMMNILHSEDFWGVE